MNKILKVALVLFIVCLITGCKKKPTDVIENTLKFEQDVIELFKGYNLSLKPYHNNVEESDITIKYSDEDVASYDLNNVLGKKAGETLISLYYKDEFKTSIKCIVYDLSFELDGGSFNNASYIYKDDSFILPIPVKEGYTFNGWSYSKVNFEEVKEISKDLLMDTYLFAKWSKNKVMSKIIYNLDGGVLEDDAPSYYEEGISLRLPNVTKEGFEFLGWSLANDTFVEWISSSMTGDVEVFAKWKEITEYKITYVYDEGFLTSHDANSFEESYEFFFTEFYKWTGVKKTYASFKEECLNAWKTGSASVYRLYKEGGRDEVDEAYFINASSHVLTWKVWFDTFDKQVTSINKDQNAWDNEYVGYLRLYSFLTRSQSYWTNERINNIVSSIKVSTPLITYYNLGDSFELVPLTIDDGRTFLGWFTEDDVKVTKITPDMKGNLVLYAKWSASTPITSFEVLNVINKLLRFEEHKLDVLFNSDATNKKVLFISSNPDVLTIDASGKMYGVKCGEVKILVKVLGDESFNKEFSVKVYTLDFIDGSYETTTYVEPENEIKLIARLFSEKEGKILFKSNNKDIATVSNDGLVRGIKAGYAEIVAYVEENEDINLTFGVTVIPFSESDFFKVIAEAHNKEISVHKNINVAYVYLTDVLTSVSDILFNYEYNVDKTYLIPESKTVNRPGTKINNLEFITVHYTAGASASDTARSTANYFYNLNNSVSAQYCTGNDGIFMNIPDGEVGYHAGDGTGTPFKWLNTNVTATTNTKPVFGVVKNNASSTGYYFTLNGVATTIEVPTTGKRSNGEVAVMSDPSKCFTFYGPAWKVVDNTYYMGNTWACFTQTWNGAISSRGGNLNSVGIETACNKGSDLWLTYQITSKLIARLLTKYNLDYSRVVGHNMFSGKDCPQTLLYRDGEMWYPFMECVKAETELYKTMSNYTIKAVSNDPDILSDNGRIKELPRYTRTVSYTVYVTNNETNVTKQATFSTVINGTYTK